MPNSWAWASRTSTFQSGEERSAENVGLAEVLVKAGNARFSEGSLDVEVPDLRLAEAVLDVRTDPAVVELRSAPENDRVPERAAPSDRAFRSVRKRAFDILVAGSLLVGLSPVMALLAIAVALTSRGAPIFSQPRVGRNGDFFDVKKFRSMHHDSEQRLRADEFLYRKYIDNDFKLAAEEDPRVTRFGAILRSTSLDELPQLWNVLKGDMSLVGPRPVVIDEISKYEQHRPAYEAVRPGLTGAWQVSGRNEIRYPERAELDADYVNSWSFSHDLHILASTIPAVLSRRGID